MKDDAAIAAHFERHLGPAEVVYEDAKKALPRWPLGQAVGKVGPEGRCRFPSSAMDGKPKVPHPAVAQGKGLPPHPAQAGQGNRFLPHPAVVQGKGLPPHSATIGRAPAAATNPRPAVGQPRPRPAELDGSLDSPQGLLDPQVAQPMRAKESKISKKSSPPTRGIGVRTLHARGMPPPTPVAELKEWVLEDVSKNSDDIRFVYEPSGEKDKLVEEVKARLNAIVEAKLRRESDGGLGYVSKSKRYAAAIYPRPDTPTRTSLSTSYSSLKFIVFEPRSPLDYDAYPPETVHSPSGTELRQSAAYGSLSPNGHFHGVSIWTKDYPVRSGRHGLNPPRKLAKKPIACGGVEKQSGLQRIDKERLKRWVGKRQNYTPAKSAAAGERSGQNAAMGDISAADAAADYGYTEGSWEWLHLMAFTLGGIDETKINHPDNLVAGTVGANRVHKVLEDTVKSLLAKSIIEVFVKATAEIKKDSYHVADTLKYEISFRINPISGAGDLYKYDFTLDPLDPNPAQGGNLHILREILELGIKF